ncbi:unnamed protein product [Porites evermanni]|uniref:Uncharacterized protein n=1 Tax=Porites evermanni TaxID=104178 RepID=A0ABN8M8L6_9CNID|nr:unnamed protein product [Porites evermanni]
MLTPNLWTEVGLCNDALGTVHHVIYAEGNVSAGLTYVALTRVRTISNLVIEPMSYEVPYENFQLQIQNLRRGKINQFQ